ncbi:MAG: hypothetical protein JWP81_2886 [Ferruginibacter sp.]|nr:hypothetical protein [Ferruginibacter sp.]
MRLSLSFLILALPCVLAAQTTTTTTSQGSNNTAGGAYVAPVVTKTYTTPAPATTSLTPAPATNNSSPASTSSTNSPSVTYYSKGKLSQEQKEAVEFLKKKAKEDLANIKKWRKEAADKFDKFAKENKTTGLAAITHLEEQFGSSEGTHKWPETFQAVIKEGVYQVKVPQVNYYEYKVPFPANFTYSAQDDWQLDVSFDIVEQSVTSWCGIIITPSSGKDLDYMVNSANGLFENANVSVKKKFNKMTLMRRGNIFAQYLNDRLIDISTIEKENMTGGKFFLTGTAASPGYPHIVNFDDISFKILVKQ